MASKHRHVPGGWLMGLAFGICFGGAIAGPLGMLFFGAVGAALGY